MQPDNNNVSKPTRSERIAIIGAGVGGLIAGRKLRQLGYERVTVFESAPVLGGKVRTVEREGRTYDLGAIFLAEDYKIAREVVREAGLQLKEAPTRSIVDLDGNGGSKRLGQYARDRSGLIATLLAALRYWRLIGRYSSLEEPGFVGADPELHVPFAEYARGRGIEAFCSVLEPIFIAYGYGDYRTMPALYVMKLWDRHKLRHFLQLARGKKTGWPAVVPQGFLRICEAAAAGLDVRLATPVSRVERQPAESGTVIRVTTNDTTETFDRLIVAAPLERALSYLALPSQLHRIPRCPGSFLGTAKNTWPRSHISDT